VCVSGWVRSCHLYVGSLCVVVCVVIRCRCVCCVVVVVVLVLLLCCCSGAVVTLLIDVYVSAVVSAVACVMAY